MSLEKRLEQEIGWFKVVFAILAAMDISLAAWVAPNYTKTDTALFLLALFAIFVITITAVLVTKRVFKCLNKLERV